MQSMASAHYLRLKTLSGSGKLSAAARHNKRAIQRELGAAGHIDPSRSHLNYCLIGELSPEAVIAKSKAMREAAGIKKLRKNAVQGIEVLFSLPASTKIDLRAYFTACTSWLADEFGAQNVLSADVHLDEAAPHCHVLVLPLKDGRMVGDALMGNRQTMLGRQSNFYETVGKPRGLPNQKAGRLTTEEKKALEKAVLARLRATDDAVMKSAGWSVIRDHIAAAPLMWATCLGLEGIEAKPRKLRTVAQIFTSKGRGSRKRELEVAIATNAL